jgi:CBS domain-containing protein
VVTVDPDDGLTKAMNLMIENEVRRLPVVEKERVMGIISMKDIIWAIYKDKT